jgi:hypothetical protein
MGELPDLATLYDEALKKLTDGLTVEDHEVLRGKIDILRAEFVPRPQKIEGHTVLYHVDPSDPDGDDLDEGGSGTREPRKPRPTAPSTGATADPPAEVDDQQQPA